MAVGGSSVQRRRARGVARARIRTVGQEHRRRTVVALKPRHVQRGVAAVARRRQVTTPRQQQLHHRRMPAGRRQVHAVLAAHARRVHIRVGNVNQRPHLEFPQRQIFSTFLLSSPQSMNHAQSSRSWPCRPNGMVPIGGTTSAAAYTGSWGHGGSTTDRGDVAALRRLGQCTFVPRQQRNPARFLRVRAGRRRRCLLPSPLAFIVDQVIHLRTQHAHG
jgi:hypothetical protein